MSPRVSVRGKGQRSSKGTNTPRTANPPASMAAFTSLLVPDALNFHEFSWDVSGCFCYISGQESHSTPSLSHLQFLCLQRTEFPGLGGGMMRWAEEEGPADHALRLFSFGPVRPVLSRSQFPMMTHLVGGMSLCMWYLWEPTVILSSRSDSLQVPVGWCVSSFCTHSSSSVRWEGWALGSELLLPPT